MYYQSGSAYRSPYGAHGEYGASWAPKKKRLAACPPMQDAYDKWMVQKERKLRNCSWPYLGGCARKYRKKQAKLEATGKAAWQMCKGQGKIEDAQVYAVETGMAPPPMEQDIMVTQDGGTVAVAGDYDYDDSGEEKGIGGTLLIMGLVGGGALLLLLMLKK